MTRSTLFLLSAVFVAVAQAQDRSGLKQLEDSKDHWLFEFEMSTGRPLGSPDDVRSIHTLCLAEGLPRFTLGADQRGYCTLDVSLAGDRKSQLC